MSDKELLDLYASRDPQATAAMQQQYGAYCRSIISRILVDTRDVEECLNDVWLRVWNALEHQRPEYVKGWLATVARNCALNRLQKATKQVATTDDSTDELAQYLRDVTVQYEESQVLGEMISAFLELQTVHDRVAFLRRYWFGDTVNQVAVHMHWSTAKTKTVLFRMRAKLRVYLKKEGYSYGEQDN